MNPRRLRTGASKSSIDLVRELAYLCLCTQWGEEEDLRSATLMGVMQSILRRDGAIEIFVENEDAIYLNDVRAGGSSLHREFGQLLLKVGLIELVMTPGLDQDELTSFCQSLHLMHSPTSADQDFITFWYEQGGTNIRIIHTSLRSAYFPPGKTQASRKHLSLWSQEGSAEKSWLAFRPSALTRRDHSLVDAFIEEMSNEGERALRAQLSATLLAALGAHSPALGERELTFLFSRLVLDCARGGEWEVMGRVFVNLDILSGDSMKVNKHTQEVARSLVKYFKDEGFFLRFLKGLGADLSPSPKVLGWLHGDDPNKSWRHALAKLPPDELEKLTLVFSSAYETQHPFWEEAMDGLPPSTETTIKALLGQLGTTLAPRDDLIDEEDDWGSFELDSFDDGFPDELDPSLLALLDSSSISRPKLEEGISDTMLKHLDALEESLHGLSGPEEP